MDTVQRHNDLPAPNQPPLIAEVTIDAPVRWLLAGWSDLKATQFRGAFYGAVFALMGNAIVLMYDTQWQLTMGLVSGFFLLGPFVCTGLYHLSKQQTQHQNSSLWASALAWRENPGSIAFFAIILTFLMIVWVRVSVVIFALTSTTSFPSLQGLIFALFSIENVAFVVTWAGVGLLFASLVFAISVVSIPMVLDRNTDTLIAIFCSARALLKNPIPLACWAAMIVTILGASFALNFWPLLITAPVVGHGTWHAYQDLVQ